jgi:predicted DNA-binding transcriptional regulator YafY
MRRADRLFRIVQYLRGRRLTTAAQLSGWLQVSMRTVYRDVRDLSLSGVPIEGEAGVGYRLGAGYDLPPLMFDRAELQALTAGARIVEVWAGPETARAAQSALAKIAAALPEDARIELERTRLYAPSFSSPVPGGVFDRLHQAIAQREVMLIGGYRDQQDAVSERAVWPLGLYFWGAAWTLAGWCELRDNFRQFRIDRIGSLSVTGRTFPDQEGRRIEDFVRFARSDRN